MKEVVIIFSHLPWNFPVDYVKQTAKELSKKARVVVFNPCASFSLWKVIFNKKARKDYLISIGWGENREILRFFPLGILPFQRFEVVEKINKKFGLLLFKAFYFLHFGKKRPIIWNFSPYLSRLPEKFKTRKALVYDRVDQVSSLNKEENKKLKKADIFLIKKADFVFVNSPYALRFVKAHNQNAFLVPCGCNVALFFGKKIALPKEIKKIERPIIGFVGSVDYRVDFKLLYSLMKENKNWSFVFIGPIAREDRGGIKAVGFFSGFSKIKKLANGYFLGEKPKEEMIGYIESFDVCLIPYNMSQEFVRGCNPMKLYEYLARGKPVVSTPIEAVKRYSPTVKIATDATDFEKEIKKSLQERYNKKEEEKRKKVALENSWEEKVKRMWRRVVQ